MKIQKYMQKGSSQYFEFNNWYNAKVPKCGNNTIRCGLQSISASNAAKYTMKF